MILIFHIFIALFSVFYTGFVYLFPSKRKLNASYITVALTIISGTYLVLVNMSHMVSACITGLIYLGIVGSGLVAAKRKLATVDNKED